MVQETPISEHGRTMSLTTRTVKNLRVVGLAQILSLGASQIGLLVLTQILEPADIGLYAILLVIYNLALLVSTIGLDSAAIQSKDDLDCVLRTATTIRLAGVTICSAVIIVASPIVAEFYQRSDITSTLRLMCIALFIVTLGFASTIALSREIRFSELSISRATNVTVWLGVALTAALVGASYWSLPIAFVIGNAAAVMVLLIYYPLRLKLGFDRTVARNLIRYGKYPVAISFLVFLFYNLDKVIVGKMLGQELLGAYFLAYSWGTAVPNVFTNVVNSVMFPTYTKMESNLPSLTKAYLRTLKYAGYVSLPVAIGLASISSLFVNTILGSEWTEATIPLAVFSMVGLCLSMTTPAWSVFFAMGRPDRMWLETWVTFVPYVVIIVPAVVIGGLVGASFLMLVITASGLLWVWHMASTLLRTDAHAILRILWVPTVSSTAMGIVVYLGSRFVTPTAINLAILVVLGCAIYAGLVRVLADDETRHEIKDLLRLGTSR